MAVTIKEQRRRYKLFYIVFGLISFGLMWYYLSDTLIHFTTGRQFPISSFERFPLTYLIFPAELFSFVFALYFVYNLIPKKESVPAGTLSEKEKTSVAMLLPVYNEPREVVERSIIACKNISWPGKVSVYILDDSTDETDKKNMEELSRQYDCTLVRRADRKGYKAGNINNAVKNHIREDFFVILDSDQAPEPEFLEETMDYFSSPEIGYVQTPQYFINDSTPLERASKIGTNIFYQAQCMSKASDGAMPFCGTNVVVRKDAFMAVSGFSYYTATEDIELGIKMNQEGYYGAYVPKILAKGYAPQDFNAYSSQQYRWANGNLAIFRESWFKILGGKFSLRYQIHTLFTLAWWMIGVVALIYILVPIISLFFGTGTHHTWLPTHLIALLYLNVMIGIMMIYVSLKDRTADRLSVKDALLQYVLITNSMFIYLRAAINAFFGRYIGFVRTSKTRTKSGLWQIRWNLLLAAVCYGASIYALYHAATSSTIEQFRTYIPLSIWMLFYSLVLGSSILLVGEPAAKVRVRTKEQPVVKEVVT
jgi:cellulose synthase (UDP-forming)